MQHLRGACNLFTRTAHPRQRFFEPLHLIREMCLATKVMCSKFNLFNWISPLMIQINE